MIYFIFIFICASHSREAAVDPEIYILIIDITSPFLNRTQTGRVKSSAFPLLASCHPYLFRVVFRCK